MELTYVIIGRGTRSRVAGVSGRRRDAAPERFVAAPASVAKRGKLEPADVFDDEGPTSERRHGEATRPTTKQPRRHDGEAAVAEGQRGAEYRSRYRERLARRGQ